MVNVTERNSASPRAESAVVGHYSYGRQLGRLVDALAVLVAERSGPADPTLATFTAMKRDIDTIKAAAGADRGERLCRELADLRAEDPDHYGRVRGRLLELLGEQPDDSGDC